MAEETALPDRYRRIRRLTDSDSFEALVVTLLVLNAGALGLETFGDFAFADEGECGGGCALLWFFIVSQVLFVAEIVLRVLGYGPRFRDFFRDRWNVFDFVVVALSLVPMLGAHSMLARIIRVLRVLRVFSVLLRRRARDEVSP